MSVLAIFLLPTNARNEDAFRNRPGGAATPSSTVAAPTADPAQMQGPRRQSAAPAPAPAPPRPSYDLALLSSRGYESEGGYHIIEGEVLNLTSEPLRSIAAQGTWYTKDGTLVTSDDAMIDYNPILPGQRSPFKTMSRTNPAMSSYTVRFKHLFGGELATEDRRKK